MLNTQSKILADLSLWRETYTVSVAHLETNKISGKYKLGYLLLRMHHDMATIMASVCLLPDEAESELTFDGYIDSFIGIMTGFLDVWKSWSAIAFHGNDISKIASASDELKATFQNFKEVSDMNTILEDSLLDLVEKSSIIDYYMQSLDCTRDAVSYTHLTLPTICSV